MDGDKIGEDKMEESRKATVQEQAEDALRSSTVFDLECALRRALVELPEQEQGITTLKFQELAGELADKLDLWFEENSERMHPDGPSEMEMAALVGAALGKLVLDWFLEDDEDYGEDSV